MKARLLEASVLAALLVGCGDPSLGDMPALCAADGVCPDGYDCIHGVCALPGTPVPITVAVVPYLRGIDMRLVPQTKSALVVWETYAYSAEGQGFVGARVAADGSVSPRMDIVGRFVAEDDSLEPYFDVLPVSSERVLVAISAPSLPDDSSAKPRLITYRADLPPEGRESESPIFEAAWAEEQRMDTVGYGAVSVPRLLQRGDRVELGYVRSRTTLVMDKPETIAELAVFSLGEDGAMIAPDPTYHPARVGLPVAVGVRGAFSLASGAWWILDDERPSALYRLDAGGEAEIKLGRLAVPVEGDAASLTYIAPSPRAGEKLPTDPVSGPATLRKIDAPVIGMPSMSMETELATLGEIRDTPRPSWVHREGAPSLLVTPGADIDAPSLFVHAVDPATGTATLVTSIPRLSSRAIDSVQAVLVDGKLFVTWLESDSDTSTIRAAVVPEP